MINYDEQYDLTDTIDLLEIVQQVKKYFWVLLLAMLLTGGAGFFCSKFFMDQQYESSITMIVNTRKDNSADVTNDNITCAQNLVSTYAVILKSNTVLNQVIRTLNLDMSYDELQKSVSVTVVDNTQIMRVAVRNSNRKLSGDIVNEIASVAPGVIVETVQAGSCKVTSDVITSNAPVSPDVKKVTLMGAASSMLVVMIAITICTLFKAKRLVDDKDIQKYFDLPVLGVIPEVERKGNEKIERKKEYKNSQRTHFGYAKRYPI